MNTEKHYDLIIIGGGPAGTSGAVYAARKQLASLLIAKEFGGQSSVSEEIYNWIGTPTISGQDLAKSFETHVRQYEGKGLDIISGKLVQKVAQGANGDFIVTLDSGETYHTTSVLVTTGSKRRKLAVPGADTFENKGVVYCASCDGPLFSGSEVVVIGGGNAGFESAAQLLAYCPKVTLIHRRDTFKADQVTVDKVLTHPNMHVITNSEPTEVLGEKFVSGIKYKNTHTGQEAEIPCSGIFVEIGQIPNTDSVQDLVSLNEFGNIIIDPKTQRTSIEGIWAAGDATDVLYHQNNISAGDAVKALEDLYLWIKTR
jgi:NADH-dependent peroxiredoxin subunit F